MLWLTACGALWMLIELWLGLRRARGFGQAEAQDHYLSATVLGFLVFGLAAIGPGGP